MAAVYEVDVRTVTFGVPLWVILAVLIIGAGIAAAMVLWLWRRSQRS